MCGCATRSGAPELIAHEDYKTGGARYRNRDALNAEIEAKTAAKTSAEWVDLLNEAGVPCGPINYVDETLEDPQVKHLGIATPVESDALGRIEVVGQAVNLERTPQPSEMRRATPEIGEHSDEVLGEAGFSAEEIAALRESATI